MIELLVRWYDEVLELVNDIKCWVYIKLDEEGDWEIFVWLLLIYILLLWELGIKVGVLGLNWLLEILLILKWCCGIVNMIGFFLICDFFVFMDFRRFMNCFGIFLMGLTSLRLLYM